MNYTRLTPLKEDLLAARKKLGQQDGKILLLSSQLEKKRNLAAEFEGQVQRLTTTVKERDVEITNLHGNLRKPQEAVALRPADGDAQVEAMLLHWQRSAGYRYVISGKDSNNFMSSPQNRLLSSVKKANRSFTFSPSPSPIPMGSSSPKASDRCPFPLSFQKKLFSPPAAPAPVAVQSQPRRASPRCSSRGTPAWTSATTRSMATSWMRHSCRRTWTCPSIRWTPPWISAHRRRRLCGPRALPCLLPQAQVQAQAL